MLVGDTDRVFRLLAQSGDVTITERPEGEADAVVTGDEEAWIAALGPDGSTAALDISGRAALARTLLAGFTAAATRAATRAA